VKQSAPWTSQLPPASAHGEQARRATANAARPQREATQAVAASSRPPPEQAALAWADSHDAAIPRADFLATSPASNPIRSSQIAQLFESGAGGRWPELPSIDVGSEQARRAVDAIEERARIERLQRDQTERLWNG
jgi:hypothetical protein